MQFKNISVTMRNISIVFIVATVLCTACQDKKEHIERVNIKAEIITDSLFSRLPGKLLLYNPDYLVWQSSFSTDTFLYVVDIKEKKEIGKMGIIGRGDKEFMTPVLGQATGKNILVYDDNIAKQVLYSIDSLLQGKDPFVQLPKMPVDGCTQLIQTDDSTFITLQPDQKKPFQIIRNNKSYSFFGELPIKEDIYNGYDIFQGTLIFDPYNQNLLYSARRFPYLALYEKEGDSFHLKWEKKFPVNYSVKNKKMALAQENKSGLPSIILTKDYIITLEKDEHTAPIVKKPTPGIRDLSQLPYTMFLYDYDFNLKKIINLNIPLLRIAGNSLSNTVYLIGLDGSYSILKCEV